MTKEEVTELVNQMIAAVVPMMIFVALNDHEDRKRAVGMAIERERLIEKIGETKFVSMVNGITEEQALKLIEEGRAMVKEE